MGKEVLRIMLWKIYSEELQTYWTLLNRSNILSEQRNECICKNIIDETKILFIVIFFRSIKVEIVSMNCNWQIFSYLLRWLDFFRLWRSGRSCCWSLNQWSVILLLPWWTSTLKRTKYEKYVFFVSFKRMKKTKKMSSSKF